MLLIEVKTHDSNLCYFVDSVVVVVVLKKENLRAECQWDCWGNGWLVRPSAEKNTKETLW